MSNRNIQFGQQQRAGQGQARVEWGRGAQRGGGGGPGQNRFSPLADQGGNGGPAQSQGRAQQQGRDQANRGSVDWRAIVRHDLHNERPTWPATCYAHERGGANDLAGDMSPEEVHFALTRTEGAASAGTLDTRLGKATRTQLVQLQELLKAQRPPSLGGPHIAGPTAAEDLLGVVGSGQLLFNCAEGMSGFASAAPFTPSGQSIPAFGSRPWAAPLPNGGSGSRAPTSVPFGGEGVQQRPGGALGRPENPAPVFPFGSGPALGGAFGELAGQQEGTGQQHNASAFGATQATSSLGRAPDQTDAMSAEMKPPAALTGIVDQKLASVWQAATFERGNIPECVPPPMFCHG